MERLGTRLIYLSFWLNVCIITVNVERGMKKIAKGGTRKAAIQNNIPIYPSRPNIYEIRIRLNPS